MARRALRGALAVCASVTCGGAAHAAYPSGKDCTGYASLKDDPTLEVGKVVGDAKRVYFVKSYMDDQGCPAATGACRRKAFLVPGNGVIVSSHTGDFACVTYVNAKGVETNGWLPNAALAIDSPGASPSIEDWVGAWVREEAKVKIKADGKGGLAIHGDATFGALDPDQVKRGNVHVGEISGAVRPTGDKLSFAMGDDGKTLPVADKSDDGTCKVWMRRVGPFLLVDDNNACGGMNVSFRGTYSRR